MKQDFLTVLWHTIAVTDHTGQYCLRLPLGNCSCTNDARLRNVQSSARSRFLNWIWVASDLYLWYRIWATFRDKCFFQHFSLNVAQILPGLINPWDFYHWKLCRLIFKYGKGKISRYQSGIQGWVEATAILDWFKSFEIASFSHFISQLYLECLVVWAGLQYILQ